MLLKGDCLELLRGLPDCSVDSVVTDPPYGLEFMGKEWDSFVGGGGVGWKPGQMGDIQSLPDGSSYKQKGFGQLPVFRGMTNAQKVSFQQFCYEWAAECLRVLKPGGHLLAFGGTRTYHRMVVAIEDAGFEIRDSIHWIYGSGFPKSLDVSKAIDKQAGAERQVVGTSKGVKVSAEDNRHGGINRGAVGIKQVSADIPVTAPATAEAQKWEGWGTALKPAHEPVVVARKPLCGTVAGNVLGWGVGGLNIDACRVAGVLEGDPSRFAKTDGGSFNAFVEPPVVRAEGRWPANVVHDGSPEVCDRFGDASRFFGGLGWGDVDVGSFLYCAKAGKRERNAGDTDNRHPTVKPIALMRWLVRLVTPPDGTVLDPFLGSGTTAVAATLEGVNWIGCEMTEDYWPIIEGRVLWAEGQRGLL